MRTRGRGGSARAALLAAVLAITGCGGGGEAASTGGGDAAAAEKKAAVYERFGELSGAERERALLEATEAEGGTVSLYTTNSDIDPIVDGFEEKYGIEVETYRAGSETLLQRVLQEQRAGYFGADVYEDADAALVVKEGLAGTYRHPELTSQIADYEKAGGIVPTRLGVYVVGWNTDLVSEDEIPDTLEGFTDPKWKGRLSMEPGDWAWYLAVRKQMETEGKSAAEIEEIFRTLVSYSTLVSGHTLQGQLLAAGEYGVALSSYSHTIDTDAAEEAPVAWRKADGSYVNPVTYVQEGAVPIKTAPHPAAALLLIDYMLTEGQKITAENLRPAAIPQAGLLDGVELQLVPGEEYFDNRTKWVEEYAALIGEREVVEG